MDRISPKFLGHGALGLSYVWATSAQSLTSGSPLHNPPFGLPPSSFALALASPISHASFPTTGYNTSIPAGPSDATGNGIPGWSLEISVAANVPLTNSADESVSAEDKKSKVTEAAVLSLVPPSTLQGLDEESWRVCAIVFTGGLAAGKTEEAQTKELDGTCAALLPSECIQELQVNSVANSTDRGQECGRLIVPDACLEHFGGTMALGRYHGLDVDFVLTKPLLQEVNSSNFDQTNRRYSFFAGASAPTGKDNATALVAMERVVWPVVITWTHFSASGEVHDSAGWLSCVKPPNTTKWITAESGMPDSLAAVWQERPSGLD
ncbi:hypothetical protein QBC32DRAFT_373008 [Pseudoneurospora amorphoporcata]|uniref:Uncharacterized protein n=1 Tax=Pseudoneurospora amorphoporcata TaxID=241081 RepID=A0AAN6NNJ5_9PEZI|nr:hypothetical protein QBC32DRAFT_373008 [Pseudoneurospora amorphoporcata]